MEDFDERYQAHRREYETLHPPPVMRRLSFAEEVGLDAALAVVTVIAAVILSAIRTATIFALTEALLLRSYSAFGALDGFLPAIAAVSALVALEGVLAVAGYVRARNSERQDIPPVVVWLALVTVIVAGLRASLALLDLPSDNAVVVGVNLVLVIMTAFAPPLIVHFGGHIVGAVHVRWRAVVRAERERYNGELDEWERSLSASFVRKERIANLRAANERRTNEPELANRRTTGEQPANERTNEHERYERSPEFVRTRRTNAFGSGERSKLVRSIVRSFVEEQRRVPSNSEVCAILAENDGGRPPENFKGFVFDVMRRMRDGGEI